MTSITDLVTKIEAAKLAGNGILLNADELEGFLQFASLIGRGETVLSPEERHDLATRSQESDEVITIEEVCALLRTSRQTLYRWRRDGKFTPEPINSQGTRWLRSEVLDWRRERKS